MTMVKLVKKGDGKWYLIDEGGHQNREIIPSGEVEVKLPLSKVDVFEYREETRYGYGEHFVTIYRDASGKEIAIHKFKWYPASGYSWEEEWEVTVEEKRRINELKAQKVIEEREL